MSCIFIKFDNVVHEAKVTFFCH